MGRWEPDAAGRLREAAMALYAERGYDGTTVADIADRAGVTARTFFRHFTDKREVLFAGSEELQQEVVDAVEGAPATAPPIEAVEAGVQAAAALLDGGREHSLRRQGVIDASAELRERELIKMASLSGALGGALRRRGVDEPAASLTAEAGIGVFRVAFDRWLRDPAGRAFPDVVRESFHALWALAGGAGG
jgi:AcrR family transcriptional regulator